ncbi:UbiA family prenyltransferase [Candidatus Woesearchaeota archaeon]|nr:UbiA family prenyltransferase [Candidatus Woesearchaeota archaeon]
MGGFSELLKATRVQRALTALTTMMVPVGFADKINLNIMHLGIVCILIYAVAGIQNAQKDKDYELPKNFKIFSASILAVALLFSLKNVVIFLTFLSWLLLGLFYNTIARFIMFGDVTVLSITHHALPTLSASLLLGLDFKTTVTLSLFVFVTFWFIIHLKNLKDAREDKARGYRTINLNLKKGLISTKLLFEIAFFCIFIGYFIFNLSKTYLYAFAAVLIMKIIISYLVELKKYEKALNLTRLLAIIFLSAMIVDKAKSQSVVFTTSILCLSYLAFLGTDAIKLKAVEKGAVQKIPAPG